jgi:hypothetical protein
MVAYVNLASVSPYGGHSSLLVTSIYLHPTDEELAGAVRRIPC